MIDQKEIEEFLVRFAGAMAGGLEDAALEAYFKLHPEMANQFPYVAVADGKLPSGDDLIVGGLAIPAWVIGALMEEDGKKRGDIKAKELGKNLEMFGEGNVVYAFNMLINRTVGRLPEPKWWPPEARAIGTRRSSAAPTRRADVAHRIIKL